MNASQRFRLSPLALAIALSVALAGCAGCDRGAGDGSFTYALGAEITSLDPIRATEDQPRLITTQVMETLVGFDEDLDLQPVLATEFEPSDSARTWTFRLRPDVRFHDHPAFKGTPRSVSADDVVYSISRLVSDSTSLGAWILSDVLGGLGEDSTSALGVRAVDPLTVEFTLQRSYPQFPTRLTLPFTAVIPREVVEAEGDRFALRPVGTGPFQVEPEAGGPDRVVLTRYEGYWRELPTNLQRVTFLTARSAQTILGDFLQGRVDAFELAPAAADQVLRDGELSTRYADAQVLQEPLLKAHFIAFDYELPINQSRAFRQAVNYAVDKEELTRDVLNALAVPATGPIPQGMEASADSAAYPYDPDRARQLLQESGYEGESITLLSDNSAESTAVAEYLERRLRELGVQIEIDSNPEPVWVDRLVSGDFEWGKLYFSVDYPSPDNPMAQFVAANAAPNGPNFGGYQNPTYDSLYTVALQSMDPAEAANIFARLNRLVVDDPPWLFLYQPTRTVVVREGVEGLQISPLSFSLFLNEVDV